MWRRGPSSHAGGVDGGQAAPVEEDLYGLGWGNGLRRGRARRGGNRAHAPPRGRV